MPDYQNYLLKKINLLHYAQLQKDNIQHKCAVAMNNI